MTSKEASNAENSAEEGMEHRTNCDLDDLNEIVQEIRTEEMHPTNENILGNEGSDSFVETRKSDDQGLNSQ